MSRKEYVPYVKEVRITEHKAPTDESIRILNDMQEKARQNIVASVIIDDNRLNAVAILFRDDPPSHAIIMAVRFTLNGVEYKLSQSIDLTIFKEANPMSTFKEFNQRLVIEFIHKKISEIIATEIINQIGIPEHPALRINYGA